MVSWRLRVLGSMSAFILVSLIAVAAPLPATAQEVHAFNVSATDPASAIRAFGAQADIQILASADDLKGKKFNSVTGDISIERGLNELLAGTGLDHRYVSERAVALVNNSSAAAVVPAKISSSSTTAGEASQQEGKAGSSESFRVAQVAQGQTASSGSVEQKNQASVESELSEVVVTAERREENLNKVPISVSVATQPEMDREGVRDFYDLAVQTPGVQYDPSTNLITIRGISGTGGPATTGVYIDDTPIQVSNIGTDSANAAPRIFDLQRVEVLRGPQGTLFGSGSEGGTVRFIMNQPSLNEYTGYARSDLNQVQNGGTGYEIGGAYGGPIIQDKLGFRISAWYQETPGWVDRVNYMNGGVLNSDANWGYTKQARAAFLWAPTENIKITPAVHYQSAYNGLLNPGVGNYTQEFSNPGQTQFANNAVVNQPAEDTYLLSSLNVSWTMGWAELISDTSYFDRNASAQEDYTPTLGFLYPAGITPTSITIPGYTSFQLAEPSTNTNHQYNFVQELRLQSPANTESRIHWVAGLYYAHLNQTNLEEQHESSTPNGINQIPESLFGATWLQALGEQPVVAYGIPNGTLSFYGRRQEKNIQEAAYTDVKYNLTKALSVDVGYRVARESFTFNSEQDGPYNGGPTAFIGSGTQSPVTPKYNVSYQLNDSNLFYVTAAKGYRSGGATRPAPVSQCEQSLELLGLSTPPSVYKSDSTWSYEIGSKNSFADNRVRLASSAYIIDWKNIQTQIPYPTCPFTFTGNVGKARSEGFDLQADAQITRSLLVSAAIGHDDAIYTASLINPGGAVLVDKGDTLDVPPWTATVSGTYSFALGEHKGYLYIQDVELQHDPKYSVTTDPRAATYIPLAINPQAENRLNARLGTVIESCDLSVYVNNLTNDHPILTQGPTFGGIVGGPIVDTTIQPRTIGVTAVLHF